MNLAVAQVWARSALTREFRTENRSGRALWKGPRLAPVILILTNLLAMVPYAITSVQAGQMLWGVALVLLAATPAAATLLLLPGLWSGAWSSGLVRAAILVFILVLAVRIVPPYFVAVSTDLGHAAAPPHTSAPFA